MELPLNKREEVFVEFLRSNEAYDAYMNCYHKRYHDPELFSVFMKTAEPKTYIEGAFIWEYTKQGFQYWYHLSILWQYILKS